MTTAARKSAAGSPWRVARRAVQYFSWGVADQAIGAMTNFLLTIYIARTLGAVGFGSFSLAYVTYGFANNILRGLAIEPFLTRFSGTELTLWRRAVVGCTGTAVVVGVVTGACAFVTGTLMGGITGLAFTGLGLALPGLMLQDSWRYVFFSQRRGHHAFVIDAVWALVQIPLLLILRATGHADVFGCVLAWGAGAAVSAVVGALLARVVPDPRQARAWLRQHRDLGLRYLAENTGNNAADTFRSYAVSGILGLSAVGYMQAANTLLGPFKILYFGLSLIVTPEAVRILRHSPRRLPLFCAAVSVGLATLALLWGAALLVAMPLGLGHLALGALWRPAYPLVLPTAIGIISTCATLGALQGLHAMGAAHRSLRAVLVTSTVVLSSTVVGAEVDGVITAMYCYAVSTWLGTVLMWLHFRKAVHESGIPLPAWLWPPRPPVRSAASSAPESV